MTGLDSKSASVRFFRLPVRGKTTAPAKPDVRAEVYFDPKTLAIVKASK